MYVTPVNEILALTSVNSGFYHFFLFGTKIKAYAQLNFQHPAQKGKRPLTRCSGAYNPRVSWGGYTCLEETFTRLAPNFPGLPSLFWHGTHIFRL